MIITYINDNQRQDLEELKEAFNSNETTIDELAGQFNAFLAAKNIDSLSLSKNDEVTDLSNISFITSDYHNDHYDRSKIQKLMQLLPLLTGIKKFSCFLEFDRDSSEDLFFIELLNRALMAKRDLTSLTLSQVAPESYFLRDEAFNMIADNINQWNLRSLNIDYNLDLGKNNDDDVALDPQIEKSEPIGGTLDELDDSLLLSPLKEGMSRLIERLKYNRTIEKLNLAGILGDDKGLVTQFTKMIKANHCLKELNLMMLSIKDENLALIFAALPRSSIKIFNCNYSTDNDIGFDGCKIGDLSKVAFIDLIKSISLDKIAIGLDEESDLDEAWLNKVFGLVKNSKLQVFKSNFITDQEKIAEITAHLQKNNSSIASSTASTTVPRSVEAAVSPKRSREFGT